MENWMLQIRVVKTERALIFAAASFVAGVAFVVSCGADSETDAATDSTAQQAVSYAFETTVVEAEDVDGVQTATCPAGTSVTGGGCYCNISNGSSFLFGAEPAGNAFSCGCALQTVVRANAICAKTPLRASALTFEDTSAANEVEQRFEEQQRTWAASLE